MRSVLFVNLKYFRPFNSYQILTYNGSFCLYFTDLYEGNDLNKGYFSICDSKDSEDLEATKGEKMFTRIFYPAAFSISSFFFLITLIHFIAAEEKRKLSSVLTIGFLINALISFFTLSITYSLSQCL